MSDLAKCPYYKSNNAKAPETLCEGARVLHGDGKNRNWFQQQYCCNLENYKNCSICIGMEEYYRRMKKEGKLDEAGN